MRSVVRGGRGWRYPKQVNLNGVSATYLEDVGPLVGDEKDIEFLERLIYESDIGSLNSRML